MFPSAGQLVVVVLAHRPHDAQTCLLAALAASEVESGQTRRQALSQGSHDGLDREVARASGPQVERLEGSVPIEGCGGNQL